jgi:hypothetical protein
VSLCELRRFERAATGVTCASSSSSAPERHQGRGLLVSNVCKHCAQAGCLKIVVKVILLYKGGVRSVRGSLSSRVCWLLVLALHRIRQRTRRCQQGESVAPVGARWQRSRLFVTHSL